MESFSREDEAKIKSLQHLLLENTANLDDGTRAFIYNKFNKVKYKYLTVSEADEKCIPRNVQAFFSQPNSSICLIEGKYQKFEHAVLHEMIHSVTSINNYQLGYLETYVSFTRKFRLKAYMVANEAINEAATEFYTIKFLNDEKNASYQPFVQIYKFLSDTCGYEKLKNCYFSCDIKKLKAAIVDSFHLPNSRLVDKLFLQMDVLMNTSRITVTSKELMSLTECHFTLTQMQFCKLKFENKTLDSNDLDKLLPLIDVDSQTTPMKDSTERMVQINDILFAELLFRLDRANANSMAYNARPIKEGELECIADNILAEKDIGIYKNFIKQNLPEFIMHLCKLPRFYDESMFFLDPSLFLLTIMNEIKDKEGKFDLSQLSVEDKVRAMSLIFFGPLQFNEKKYSSFKNEDIVDFVNSGRSNWVAFRDDDLMMEYILPNIDKIDPQIKMNTQFIKRLNAAQDRVLSKQL